MSRAIAGVVDAGLDALGIAAKSEAVQKSVAKKARANRQYITANKAKPKPRAVSEEQLEAAIEEGKQEKIQRLAQQRITANQTYATTFPSRIESVYDLPEFESYVNINKRGSDVISDKAAKEAWLAEAREYWHEHRNERQPLKGFRRFTNAAGVETHRAKDSSKFRKDGSRAIKAKSLSLQESEIARRSTNLQAQEFGDEIDPLLVHHRSPANLFGAVGAGLGDTELRELWETVRYGERFPSLSIGNSATNMQGLRSADFEKIHARAHALLSAMGLDPQKIDFTGASLETRMRFLDIIAEKLKIVDEFLYNEIEVLINKNVERFPITLPSDVRGSRS